jgi:pilus assembly protein Flp/PilA
VLRDEQGATAAEYAIILAVIGAVIALAAFALGNAVGNAMNNAASCISQTTSAGFTSKCVVGP